MSDSFTDPVASTPLSNDTSPTPADASIKKLEKAPPDFKGSFGQSKENGGGRSKSMGQSSGGGGRLFVGNLASEHLTSDEFKDIFTPYGEVLDVSMHRAYGFVQFASDEACNAAMEAEQGRMVGGRQIDIQRAKSEKGGAMRSSGPRSATATRGPRRDMNGGRDARGGRDRSPGRDRRPGGNRYSSGPSGSTGRPGPSASYVPDPEDNLVVKIILLGEPQRGFANRAGQLIDNMGIPYGIEMLNGRSLSIAIKDAVTNHSRYCIIIGRENLNRGTLTLKVLHLKEDNGKCPTFDVSIEEMADIIRREETNLGFQPKSPNSNFTPSVNGPREPSLAEIQQQLQDLKNQLQAHNQSGASTTMPSLGYSSQPYGGNQGSSSNMSPQMIMEAINKLQSALPNAGYAPPPPMPSQVNYGYPPMQSSMGMPPIQSQGNYYQPPVHQQPQSFQRDMPHHQQQQTPQDNSAQTVDPNKIANLSKLLMSMKNRQA